MDLNAFPHPEEDLHHAAVLQNLPIGERIENAALIARREREERRQRLKRDFPDEGRVQVSVQRKHDLLNKMRNERIYDISELVDGGWSDCPLSVEKLYGIVPSKVPLYDAVNVPSKENHDVDVAMTSDDVLGESIPSEQQHLLQQFCYQALKIIPQNSRPFPASKPVSLDRDHLQYLPQSYFYASWKADGTRYMMLITMDGCYLIDRKFNFRRVQMRFPCKHSSEGSAERCHHFTLLDGEMIIGTVPDSRKQERIYLIHDIVAINQKFLLETPFSERWKMVEKEVIEPRNCERRYIYEIRNSYYRYELEPFRVRRKEFLPLSTVTKLRKEFIPNLSHDADGLIFQGWDDPYVPFADVDLLKWNYPERNSVDFLFEVTTDDCEQLYLHEKGKKKLMDGMKVLFRDPTDPSSYSGKIVECTWDSEEKVWVFMRVRTDKSTPNDIKTYDKVLKSIQCHDTTGHTIE